MMDIVIFITIISSPNWNSSKNLIHMECSGRLENESKRKRSLSS